MSVLELMDNANQIEPNLWIGDMRAPADDNFLIKNNINVVFNCTPSLPFSKNRIIQYKYQLAINDDLKANSIRNMALSLPAAVSTLIKHLKNNDRVLVHCHAGMQRSATLIAAYLMAKYNLTKKQAVKQIQEKRTFAFTPAVNFDQALDEWQKYISIKRKQIQKNKK